MVYLYVADISNLPDPEQHPELMKHLPEERKHKIEKILHPQSRKQSLGAGLLLERVFSRHGISSDSLRLNEQGKPEIDDLCFNLSHSSELVACAVSERPVGCDVEQQKKAPENVAEHFFSEGEKKYLKKFQGGKYDEEFFRLWTMKESYMKLTGEGLRLPLRAFEMVIGEDVKVLRGGEIQACFIKEYTVPGYKVTVCAQEMEFADIIWENI